MSRQNLSTGTSSKMGDLENNNVKDSIPDHKDEYLDDPLPDLVGNLKITEEPEPDLTLDQEFVLEDFEFNITSDEDDSGSDLEFFDATTVSSSGSGDQSNSEGLLPDHENVHVELDQNFSINNCDDNETEGGTCSGSSNSSSGTMRRLGNVRDTARKVAASVKGMVGKQKSKKHIRVTYHNLDKPYTARVSSAHHYKNYLTLGEEPTGNTFGMSQSNSVTSDLGSPIDPSLTQEEREALRAEWQGELNQVEDEIQTLRQVLNAKVRRAHELKRKLGVTVWGEFTQDMGIGIKSVRDSTAYQKTESAIKATAEKTTSIFGGIGSAMSQKIGALKNTESFRSMEERVSSAVTSVKGELQTKMGGSRSGSVQNFDEALREATANQEGGDASKPNGTSAAPTGVEDKQQPHS
ncbi:uncharacterized protein LOC110847919 isoform X3 [Folsomia candida]|uniref:uncharacterized protein LOC110847919 isoform X3 n=1 Tax=Folsomia candida TaxID=158441 RepID=UPI00160536EA|nr:uncharacterized protein LOC110847919 isoform X3 [Folsomia candida]